MTLNSRDYRDPMLVLMDKQAAEAKRNGICPKCAHTITLHLMGRDLHRCIKGKPYGSHDCQKFEAINGKA